MFTLISLLKEFSTKKSTVGIVRATMSQVQIQLPDFIDHELIQSVFEKNFSKNGTLKVLKFWAEWATKRGDNYASDMYRIHIEFIQNQKNIHKSILLKLIPSGEFQLIVLEKNQMYPREIRVYTEFMFEARKLLESIGDDTKFGPECLYTSSEPKMMLMLEDLMQSDYIMMSKDCMFQYEQALSVVRKLAKFHAVSSVLYYRNPSIMDQYLDGAISNNPNRQDFLIWFRLFVRTLSIVVGEWESSKWSNIADKLKKLEHTINEKGCQAYLRDERSFNVLNHDDLWTPNILFKCDQFKKITDVLFVDYQMVCYGSPGIDLNFFFYSSLDEEVRIKKLNELLREYHTELSRTLNKFTKLNYAAIRIPTMHDIQIELLKTGVIGMNVAFCVVPLMLMSNSENADMDSVSADNSVGHNIRYEMLNNSKYKGFVKNVLLHFDAMGYLD